MKPLSILVVDDMEEIRRLLHDWLVDLGHTVGCAAGSRELEKLLQLQHVDVVVTDILMPDGDGLEVMTAVRKIQPWARTLAISGGGAYLQATDCLNVARGFGANGVLLKPFTRQQLIVALQRLVPAEWLEESTLAR